MSRALRSAFFRYRKTGLPLYVLIFSVVIAIIVLFHAHGNIISIYMFARPRYYDNTILITAIYYLAFVIPFMSAIYSMIFTGSDISDRAVNNKIATGISRGALYFADLIFNIISTVVSLIICFIVLVVMAKTFPVREDIRIDSQIIGLFLSVTVICLAFTAVFTLIQFFFSNKFFGIVVALLLLPTVIICTASMKNALENPYRYSYEDEETGETKWSLNPHYVGGTARTVLTVICEASPYSGYVVEETSVGYSAVIGAGVVIIISTGLGYLTVRGKEYS